MRKKTLVNYIIVLTVTMLYSIVCGILNRAVITPFALMASTIVSVVLLIGAKTTGKKIIAWYYVVVVPVQLAIAMVSPQTIISSHYNTYYDEWLFWDEGVVLRYFIYSLFFVIIGFVMVSLSETLSLRSNGKRINVTGIDSTLFWSRIKLNHPFMLLTVASFFDMYIRQGAVNGYVSYFSYGFLLFGFTNVVVKASYSSSFNREIIQDLIGILIYSVPGLFSGRREYLIFGVFMVSIYLLLTKKTQVASFVKRHFATVIVIASAFVVLFGLISYYKFGVFNPVKYIISRVVGLFDGCTVLKYLEGNNVNLGFKNYVISVYNDSAIRANKFYTNTIIGFPTTAKTNSAAPIFIVSLLYGKIGMIILSSFFTFLLGIFSKKMSHNVYLYRNGYSESAVIRYKIFLLSYMMVVFMNKYFMDGNVEILKEFSTPLTAYVLFILLYKFSISREQMKESMVR